MCHTYTFGMRVAFSLNCRRTHHLSIPSDLTRWVERDSVFTEHFNSHLTAPKKYRVQMSKCRQTQRLIKVHGRDNEMEFEYCFDFKIEVYMIIYHV